MMFDSFNESLIAAGVSLHWLRPGEKRPLAVNWSDLPNQAVADLRRSHIAGANLGLRPGEPSKVGDYYLHILDLDIRDASKAGEAWATLLAMLPQARALPSVISGSGGESRHIYFLTNQPFRKKKLAKSSTFTMVMDATRGREVKKNDWEIDLIGTGAQAVIPPSIHPETRQSYQWERPLDLNLVCIGVGPIVPSALVAGWGADVAQSDDDEAEDDDDLLGLVATAPLDLKDGELDRILADLPPDWVEDRDHWLTVGAALHHQFEGRREGFDRWCEWAQQSDKFDRKDSARVWKSFKGTKTPVRVATLIQAAAANRMAEELDFEDAAADDGFHAPAVVTPSTDISDLLDPAPEPPPKGDSPDGRDWNLLLHRNEEGDLKSTLHNLRIIVRNDRRLSGVVAYNEFQQSIVLRGNPGRVQKKREKSKPVVNLEGKIWKVEDEMNGDNWKDTHDNSIRAVIEAPVTQGGYGIKVSDRDLRAAVDINAHQRPFHPVCERLNRFAKEWDGHNRVETLFLDYLGCEDNAYHRQAAITVLLGAVSRVYEPGHKFDFVAILEGAQGAGKSTFIQTLGLDWSSELTGMISDPNKMIEAMQGSWIIEIGELSSMHRSEVNDLKAFVSRTHDKARLAYAKRVEVYPRQCIFIGSTNDREYLRDSTGNRRYWPIVCNLGGRMIDNLRLKQEVGQIWAEAVLMYREMRKKIPIGNLPLYISDRKAAEEVALIQQSKTMESAEETLAGQIQAWLDSPIVDGDGFDDLDAPKKVHQETCIAQIWAEALGRTTPIQQSDSSRIGKAMQIVGWHRSPGMVTTSPLNKTYGKCRIYTRPE